MTGTVSIRGFMSRPGDIDAWRLATHQRIRKGVARKMTEAAPRFKAAATAAVSRSFKIRSAAFPKAWRSRVYADKRDRLPALLVQSKIFWMGAQEAGAAIRGKLLIPFGGLRIGYRSWQRLIRSVMDAKTGFFKQIGSRTILFVRAGGASSAAGTRGRRAITLLRRTEMSGLPRLKKVRKGEAFAIATLVRSVRLRPRYSLERAVDVEVRRLARDIEGVEL